MIFEYVQPGMQFMAYHLSESTSTCSFYFYHFEIIDKHQDLIRIHWLNYHNLSWDFNDNCYHWKHDPEEVTLEISELEWEYWAASYYLTTATSIQTAQEQLTELMMKY